MLIELMAAFFGTVFFSVIFSCPKKFLLLSGLNGFVAWLVYSIILTRTHSPSFANFAATSAVVIFSQAVSFKYRSPLDVLLVPGIFVLVPGATIYQMFFSFITHNDHAAFQSFRETVSIGFSIAMAIFIFVYIFEMLNRYFILEKIKSMRREGAPENTDKIFETAILAGKIMLQSGSETHKVEETINTFCAFNGLNRVQSFVIPTGIFSTLVYKRFHPVTELARVSKRSLNLGKMSRIMELLNGYYDSASTAELLPLAEKLRNVMSLSIYRDIELLISAAFAVAFFSILFKGGIHEFILTFFVGFFAQAFIMKLARLEFPDQLINILTSSIIASTTLFLVNCFSVGRYDIIITGSVMLLVPGVTIINALREIIAGDLASGSTRGFEALVIAASIAAGAGVILKLLLK